MILAKLFTKIFKEGGIILIDSENQKYICGSPRQINPITSVSYTHLRAHETQ